MFSVPDPLESPADEHEPDLLPGGKMEIEYKLLANATQIGQIRDAVAAQRYVSGAPTHVDLVNYYYDTSDFQLRRAGLSLRIRWNGSIWVQSFKQKRESSNGVFHRLEWDRTITSGEPELDDLHRLRLPVTAPQIRRIFTTRFHRETFSLDTAAHRAAQQPGALRMSLDEGNIEVGERLLPISEVEFELESGSEASLRQVAAEFITQFALKPGRLSKAERAYRALNGPKSPEPN